jgi:hypothetical protein
MSENNLALTSQEELIEKWLPVIEGSGKWEKVCEGMPVVESQNYGILATQLECLEQVELKEATQTGNVANYTPVLIPMVRRIAPAMIGNELFGVQPMTGPSGMIFSLKSLYQGPKLGSLLTDVYYIMIVATVSGFSVGDVISGTADDTGASPAETAVGTVKQIQGNTLLVHQTNVQLDAGGSAGDETGAFAAGFVVLSGAVIAQDAGIEMTYFSTDAEALGPIVFDDFSGPMTTAVGENLGTSTNELGFEITSSTINAKTRKLKTRWTIELEDDLRAVHGMNAEQLLSGFCGDEIVKEMNREFIDQVKTYAGETADNGQAAITWNYTDVATTNAFNGRFEMERYQSLAAAISRQRRKLARANQRGQANWMIVTLGVLTALEFSGRLIKSGDTPMQNAFVGTFEGMRVYVDMFPSVATEEAVYLGYKGDEVDAGLYFCPYVPLKVNKGYGEEDNIPRLFFSTRYGVGQNPYGAKNYYQKMTISNLPA